MKLLSVVVLLLAPALTSCITKQPRDCSVIRLDKKKPSGVYTIYPTGPSSAVQVYCDMESHGGGWTVFQRRMDGSVNFYRGWDQYKAGFGCADGEHWLGLDIINSLTRGRKVELLVDMEDFNGNKRWSRYKRFSVGGPRTGYRLYVAGYMRGGKAGNSLSYHSGQRFSTFDKDQDRTRVNCARKYLGAFWYRSCHYTNPNGIYRWGYDRYYYAVGVVWYHWKRYKYSLKSISMKIRPVK